VIGGAVLLMWPALLNGYPIVFSDTAGLADMGLEPNMGWDKPWVYGPLIRLFHWSISLWGVAAAQVMAVSAVLWLVGRVAGLAGPWRHLALCAVLAVGTAAPWFASFIMPDIAAPLLVLCLYVMAWGRATLGPAARTAVGTLAAAAIASHLAHLLVAAGCLVAIAAMRPRRLLVCAVPLVAALAWLLGSNLVGNGVLGVSPYGSVFALARLQADGPAADYLRHACPAAGYRLCAWADRLPMDSDAFLWAPDGPVWGGDSGPTRIAPEASRIVAATIWFEPGQVLRDAAANTLRQLVRVRLGDVLGPQYLVSTVGLLLLTYFPVPEIQRFEASRQVHGTLAAVAAPLLPLDLPLLLVGALGSVAIIVTWRSHPALAGLAVIAFVGVVANAFATGALSGPHDRYAARIAWILLLSSLLAAGQRLKASPSGRALGEGRPSPEA
jgi:hypothetical protein